MPILDPIEMEYARRGLAGEPVDPSMLYAEQDASLDPSVGLPPDVLAQEGGVGNVPEEALGAEGGSGGAAPPPVAVAGGGYEGAPAAPDPTMGGGTREVLPPVNLSIPEAQAAAPAAPAAPVAPRGPVVPENVTLAEEGPAPWLRQYMGAELGQPEGVDRDVHLPGIPLTPGEERAAREIQGEQYANIEDQFEAQKYAREATARAEAAAEEQRRATELQIREREQQRINDLQKMEARFREMADKAAAEPIDSERLWNNKGTGEKIMLTIGVALGAAGQALSGAPNVAFQKLQADIDRDIEAQKANKQGKYQRLAEEGSLIGMARERHASEASMDASMREVAYRKVGQELERFAQFAQDPARRAAADALKSQVDAQILQAEQQRRQGNEIYLLQLQRAQAAARGAGKPNDALFVPKWGYARDQKALEGARGLAITSDEITATIADMRRLRKEGAKYGAWGVGNPAYHKAMQLRGKLVGSVAKNNSGGFNPSQAMEERTAKEVLDPTGLSDSEFEAKAEGLLNVTKNVTESGMNQYIKQRVHPSYKPESER